jgi:DNA-binding CsgD family transcriptional regulator
VRSAFWLAFGLMQRGDVAQGSGWLARAGRLVEEHEPDMVERGYLQVPAGLRALGEGEPGRALERFDEAETLGRRHGDRDLTALGVLGRGEALLHLGRTSDGLRLFDEAMVSVTSGETSPTIAGLVYCAVIDGCHHVFDVRRAREWTAALERWCDQQPGLVPYRGQCLVHRAQVLQIRGDWDAAIAELEQARRWLSNPPHPAVGMADYQLGELRRLRGELRTAEVAYRRAHAAGRDPQPGLALLRLAEGAVETSASAIEHALSSAADPVTRAQLLPAYAEIMLTAGRHDAAAVAADELEALAADGAPLLGAIAAQTRGSIMLADGDAEAALVELRAALDAWQELGAPYEAAQVRMLIADACGQLHDRERAGLECEAAREVFDALGATPALDHLDRVLADAARGATDPSAAVPSRPLPVTGRELDLLRLVAAGRTNREIASELAISEKTVERHLGNVFTKLGVSNRTAAIAHAYRHGML